MTKVRAPERTPAASRNLYIEPAPASRSHKSLEDIDRFDDRMVPCFAEAPWPTSSELLERVPTSLGLRPELASSGKKAHVP